MTNKPHPLNIIAQHHQIMDSLQEHRTRFRFPEVAMYLSSLIVLTVLVFLYPYRLCFQAYLLYLWVRVFIARRRLINVISNLAEDDNNKRM